MIEKPLENVGKEDIERLRANGVSESRSLDYKERLPGVTDDERKEFLADVTSLANTSGGDLIFGVREMREGGRPTGMPDSIDGVSDVNCDHESLRLEGILRDGVAPRLPGIRLRWIMGFERGPVLIIRIPRSWAGPHMVTYKQHSRFYARNAAGKYALDVFELRQAFLGNAAVRERVREFRTERVGRLLSGELPVTLTRNLLVSVHVIPHAALAGGFEIDLLLAANQTDLLAPLYSHGLSWTFNLEGFVTYSNLQAGQSMSYLQVHHNGVLETVSSELVTARGESKQLTLPCLTFADELNAFVSRARRLLKLIDTEPPASLFVSLLGVKGVILGLSSQLTFHRDTHARPFDRDNLLLRDLMLTDWENDDTRKVLRPILDQLWQAAGLARCFDYDTNGNWKPHP